MHRNLMEEKHLDLQQPFLSVRRFSPAVPPSGTEKKKKDNSFQKVPVLPFYKSDLKSGPIRNPGTVPFVWEKIPGRPKDESQLQTEYHTQFSIAPKLPPGRIVTVKQGLSFRGASEPITDAPQESSALSTSTNVSATDGDMCDALDSRAREGSVEKHSCGSEDGDEAYVDALDTLSRTESFFLNCSLSGLSGLDTSDGKASGTNPTDSRTRDFMMDRFLPAAKAIASEAPQHVSRKQPVVRDDTRVTKMVVSRDKPPVDTYKPNVVRDYALNYKVEESENEDDDYDEPGNFSGKVCGLLPRFCLNNSLSVMTPVPGMRIRARGTSVRRRHSKFSTAGLCRESQTETNAINQGQSVYSRKPNGPLEDGSKVKGISNRPTNRANCHESDGLLFQRHSRGGDASPKNQVLSHCPPDEKLGFSGSPGEAKDLVNNVGSPAVGRTFQELLADPSTELESGFSDSAIEKTLYIDSVHKYKSSNSSSLEDKTLSESKVSKNPTNFEEMRMSSDTDSSPQDGNHVNIDNERTEFQLQLDSFVQSRSVQEIPIEAEMSPKQGLDVIKDPISSTRKDMFDNWKIDFEAKQMPKAKGGGKSRGTHQLLPLPPPLPKSPSESWLCRTLPHLSSQKLSSRSYLVSGAYGQPSTTTNHTNREAAYRSSKAHYGHMGLAQEMLTPIPET